ncbi:MAG: hypothetical protein JWQ96_806 [Segetibacter sp.]|nr:hypothetical protein [Segetibacter sp.]
MYLFKSLNKVIKRVRVHVKDEVKKSITNIENRLLEIANTETAYYVLNNMELAIPLNTSFEVYDFIFNKVPLIEDGLYCEFGVYKGSSINYMAPNKNVTFHGFDSFEGLPEYWKPGYGEGFFDLKGALPKFEANVVLHKGWFNETLPLFVQQNSQPLALLHVDCDLYSSTKVIFDFMKHRIIEGTIIIFDEYFNYPRWQEHEFKAFQEWIEETGYEYEYLCYNQLHEQVAVRILGKAS